MSRFVYADNAATTSLDKRVLDAMMPYLTEYYGNASSSFYAIGQKSRKALDEARATVARCLGAQPNEIYFTGSGSEADNWVLKGIASAYKKKGNHIITSKIEHHAILHSLKALEKEGVEVTYLDVDKDGLVDLEQLKASIKDTTILISVMFANNEIGTIEPIQEIGQIAHEHGVLFHTDAVQAVGHCPINLAELPVDMLSLSAHKFHGPKGVGALYLKKGIRLNNLIDGGAQERGKRASTENVAGIVGLAKALELATDHMEENSKKTRALSQALIKGLLEIPHTKLNGHPEKRLDNNVNISFFGVEGETILMDLNANGICASTGSACASGSLDPSHVLLSIGLKHEEAHCSIRLTLDAENTMEDVDYIIQVMKDRLAFRRMMSPLYEDILKKEQQA